MCLENMMKQSTIDLESKLDLEINHLDIAESFFLGKVKHGEKEYKINIQGHWKEKLIKLPLKIDHDGKVLVRFSGARNIVVEDYLKYSGKSEWVEVDSDDILHSIADNQDEFDTLEILW